MILQKLVDHERFLSENQTEGSISLEKMTWDWKLKLVEPPNVGAAKD